MGTINLNHICVIMNDTSIRSQGNYFVIPESNRQIPKTNYRELTLDETEAIVSDERTIDLSVSSDKPYERWWYYEILDHTDGAVDLSRMNDGAMSLYNHKRDDYLGVIEKAWLDGGKLYNTIRFDEHELAEKIVCSINKGIIKNVSIGYMVHELVLVKKSDDDLNTYKATRWTPFESSFVTVPADATVGVGRQYFDFSQPITGEVKEITPPWEELNQKVNQINKTVENFIQEEKNMGDENQANTAVIEIDEKDIRAKERDRVRGISALVQKYGYSELGERAIDEGMSVQEARSLYLDKVTSGEQSPVARTLSPVDMSNKERKQYSFLKAIGYAAGRVSAKDAGLELEVSDYIQQSRMRGKPPEGIYVDQTQLVSYEKSYAERAPYDTATPAAAGNLIETELLSDRFIEQLYNQSAFLSMGVTYMRDLTGNVEIPRESTFTRGYWIGEGQPITEEEGTFDKINLSPKKLACLTKMTYEMINQSSIDIERYARARLIRGLALELDRTIGFGSGIGEEPLGIVSHPEVLSLALGTNGGALDWAAVINLQSLVDQANAMMGGSFGYVVNSKTKAKLMTTLDHTTGSGNWIWQSSGGSDGTIAGYQAKCSNQIPNNLTKGTGTNLSAIFFGDFANVLLGIWSGLDVMVDPYSESSNAIIKIIAKQLVDLELTRGEYFSVATDLINT